MIIAIDETGSFNAKSKAKSFFIAINIRQRKSMYKLKQHQFIQWENSLPRKLKSTKGEIKSSSLSDEQLAEFASRIVYDHYSIGITPFCIDPAKNPETIVDKHRKVQLIGIRESARELRELNRGVDAQRWEDFGNWFEKLSYVQYLKIVVLGKCIVRSLVNTVRKAIIDKYDEDELPRLKFLIDRDFIKERSHNIFWREILRNQLYYFSEKDPLPLLKKWKKKGHPFIDKFNKEGRLDFNKLFWDQCSFESSHEYFEIRIADAVNTIISRYYNKQQCHQAYLIAEKCFLGDGLINELLLGDFNLDDWQYSPEENPWRNKLSILELSN